MQGNNCYDIIIIGGGISGITAAIYAKRAGRKVVVIERMAVGGQLNFVGKIENYSGFLGLDGVTLAENLNRQIKTLDIEVVYDEVTQYSLKGKEKSIVCKNHQYTSQAVILALGSNPKELEIDGEKKFKGSGVSYCVQCDGNFFKNRTVAVIGST